MSTFSFKNAKARLQNIIKEELFYRDFYRASELMIFDEKDTKPDNKEKKDETNTK